MIKRARMGELKLKVLNTITDGALSFADIILALGMIETGFGASYFGMKKELTKMRRAREHQQAEKIERHKISSIVYNLKKDGLLADTKNNFSVTAKGLEKIKNLSEKIFLNKKYQKDGVKNSLIIFAYDFPEKLRKYRNWLRSVLKKLDYLVIQKSFFVGTTKIPPALIEDLRRLSLLKYVQIFTVDKKGSLINTLDDRLKY